MSKTTTEMAQEIIKRKLTTFTCSLSSKRIKPSDRCPRLFYYDIRHGDDWGTPLNIESEVFVNHWGTLISNVDLSLLFIRSDYYKVSKAMQNFIFNNIDAGEFDGKGLFQKITI